MNEKRHKTKKCRPCLYAPHGRIAQRGEEGGYAPTRTWMSQVPHVSTKQTSRTYCGKVSPTPSFNINRSPRRGISGTSNRHTFTCAPPGNSLSFCIITSILIINVCKWPNDPKLSHGHRTVTPKCKRDNQISYPGPKLKARWPLAPARC